jgi:adenylosuccinate lyase
MSNRYESPLASRYASAGMSSLWSSYGRVESYRQVWIALAQAERELGVAISAEQIEQLIKQKNTIDLQAIARYEKLFKHDVVANIHAYADLCPLARPIIHLGATSCTITDNADLIVIKQALIFVQEKLLRVILLLADKADEYKNMPCLAFTHGQVAQPTTVGKRIAGWLQDLLFDYKKISRQINELYLLGLKGATGTQASFLTLMQNDTHKLEHLEQRFGELLGFSNIVSLSGQTYSRKQDLDILNVLADIAISAHKMATDLRLLAMNKEISEPFEEHQVGSSAMPYKRNPMKAERICSLARFVMSLIANPQYTAATQWFERTLDDSANRRLSIPEAFLATDGILQLLLTICDGMVVHTERIAANLQKEFPFLLIEQIIINAVDLGADRQEIHELLRTHCMASYQKIMAGDANDLLERIAADPEIPITLEELQSLKIEDLIGTAPAQVSRFLEKEIEPLRPLLDQQFKMEQISV